MHNFLACSILIIYIYAFSRRFYPKRLALHSSYSFYILSGLADLEPMILALASAMLYQLSYRKANYIFVSLFRIYLLYNVFFFSLFLFSRSGVMSNMRPKICDGLAIQQGLL